MMQEAVVVTERSEIRDRLVRLMNEIAKIPVEQITDAATVDEELHMESVAFVELIVAIEEEYQVEIDPIRVVELNQFGPIVDYVYEQVATQRG
jgi:acyl carrier protein